jgi:O-methyltransferase
MHRYSLLQYIRIAAGKIPMLRQFYNFLTLLFVPTYREDGLCTTHNCDYLKTKSFQSAYAAALRLQPGVDIRWRAHVTQWAGSHAARLSGDFVECGVNRGFLSMSVMTYIDFNRLPDRKFYLFDTYSGLVDDQVTAEDKAAFRNYYENTYECVVDSFREFTNAVIVKGVVPESLKTVRIDQVAYLSIDMNCTQPELAALEYFWPKMVSGGVIVLDDYGFSGHEAQKKAADGFAAKMGACILSVPTGQGLLIKPPAK